jgi:putative resolvase
MYDTIYGMKLSDWAKKQGISYRSAWNQYKSGKLGVPARQLPTGTIIVDVPEKPNKAIIYSRVSSHNQKGDLLGQIERCSNYAAKHNIPIHNIISEVGSGMNGKRKRLLKTLSDPDVTHIIVEHRDRFMRFGSEYVEAALTARGAKLLVIEDSELNDDLVQDMVSVLTSFCARLYGKRAAKNRAQKMLEAGDD